MKVSLGLFIFCILFFRCFECCSAASQSEAEAALSEAENNLISVYMAVEEAEAAGANTSTLTAKLEYAGRLLVLEDS